MRPPFILVCLLVKLSISTPSLSIEIYVAIDLKSVYASCKCVALGLDPLNTNLVVINQSRTEKTICLAVVSPSLKSYGISDRARLFEVVQRVKEGPMSNGSGKLPTDSSRTIASFTRSLCRTLPSPLTMW